MMIAIATLVLSYHSFFISLPTLLELLLANMIYVKWDLILVLILIKIH